MPLRWRAPTRRLACNKLGTGYPGHPVFIGGRRWLNADDLADPLKSSPDRNSLPLHPGADIVEAITRDTYETLLDHRIARTLDVLLFDISTTERQAPLFRPTAREPRLRRDGDLFR